MAKSTARYSKIPWTGGVNTSVDPGVLPSDDLVQADNVVFNIAGSRLKREGFEYFDTGIRQPDFKSSSGTTRTLTWTTQSIYQTSGSTDDVVFAGENLTITGDVDYNGNISVATKSRQAQAREVVMPADAAGSLGGKYFVINTPYGGVSYYVWVDVDNGSTDPGISGKTGVEVNISSGDSANTVASAVQAAVDALSDISASVTGDTVTITNDDPGIVLNETQPAAGSFAPTSVTVTTRGEESITYIGSSSLTESETASDLTLTRNYSIIKADDYWRTDDLNDQAQLVMVVTSDGNIIKYDTSGRREKITGKGQITSVTTVAGSSLTTGDYFNLYSGNDDTEYYVWINLNAGGGDPAPAGKTAIEVAIATADTDAQVATKVASAINASADFGASANGAVVTITNANAGRATDAADLNTGFTISTTEYGATLITSVDRVQTIIFNNRWICCFSGIDNYPVMYRPESSSLYQTLPNAPDCSIITEYLSRLWVNDKTDPHRLHYSETGSFSTWKGAGDSAAIDISPGDGDPEGIVAIYQFKSTFFVHKKTKTYRIFNNTPESFQVRPVNSSLGAESSYTAPIDNDDVMFVSRKGIHTIAATDQFGDTTNTYLSGKIQPTFETWSQTRFNLVQCAYIPELNSTAFIVPEEGRSAPSAIWLYNTVFKAWYRWPNTNPRSIALHQTADKKNKLMWGTATGRIVLSNSGNYTDFGTQGIEYRVKTGAIYPADDIQAMKAFRAITFLFKPIGGFTFTVKYKIDNGKQDAIVYQQVSSTDLLGTTFVLGQSILGTSGVLQPYTFQIDGLGRGITFEIEQTGPDEQVELYGFLIEYEDEGLRNEVNN